MLKLLTPLALLATLMAGCKKDEEPDFEPPVITDEVTIPEITQLLTRANESSLFEKQTGNILSFNDDLSDLITINADIEFQELDGFGFALTGGSADHLSAMTSDKQSELLQELFGSGEGQIGMSFIRISVGASDLDSQVFSYNDLPAGSTDTNQDNFSLEPDEEKLIPLLKKILLINPQIKIMASPWSPPAWMKDNNSPKGGSLQKAYYGSYALYLAKYIQGMADQGIDIGYLTIQNEPLHDGNNPSMYMTAAEQLEFIKNHLGPEFEEKQIETAIVAYDHNPDRFDYPITILDDPEAKKYVDGSAFHLYAGNIEALSTVHNRHPDKNIYFTEQWFGAPGNFAEDLKWHTREVVIGSVRNWSRNVIEWNLSSNADLQPHTAGGCNACLGGVTVEGDLVKRNAGYYVIAHVSRYVVPGSIRVSSSFTEALPNVAFLTPDQKLVLLVLNNSDQRKQFNVRQGSIAYATALDPGSVSTFVWSAGQ
ncbi:MAG: glucosylceramidase [Roseivirga sp.]